MSSRASLADVVCTFGLPLAIGVFAVAAAATLFKPGFTVAPSPERETSVSSRPSRSEGSAEPGQQADATLSGRSVDAPVLALPLTERDRLFLRGQALMGAGDMAAARLLLRRAAAAGHAGALFALASTYDPNVLAAVQVVGLEGEPVQARALYARALSAGIEAARPRIAALGG